MESNNFFIPKDSINCKDYYSNENDLEPLLGPFKQINLITGANSSGKSLFIRNIFKTKTLDLYDNQYYDLLTEISENIHQLAELNISVDETNETILRYSANYNSNELLIQRDARDIIMKKDSVGLNTVFFSDLVREILLRQLQGITSTENLRFIEALSEVIKAIISRIREPDTNNSLFIFDRGFYSIEQNSTVLDILYSKTKEVITVIKSRNTSENNKIYIPILRYPNLLYHNVNERAKWDYFNDTIATQYKLESQKDSIFTGQNFLEEIVKYRNGNKAQRNSFIEFEKFLSLNFFENKEIDIVANIDLGNQLNNKITFTIDGNEKSFYDIGDGVQSIILLLFPIFTAKENTWILIEEPENSLHPLYQRVFIETLLYNEFLNKKKLTYFITTHSNHILDSQFWEGENMSISLLRKQNSQDKFLIETITEQKGFDVLKELGVLNSSVLIGNCAIWVEGITDRLYIKKMLYLYLEKFNEEKQFKENNDFVFFEYAGSNIAHYIFDNDTDKSKLQGFIKTNKLANKVFLVADYDLDAKSEKTKKEERHKMLTSISTKESWFTYYNTNPRKEIENIISVEILNLLLFKLLQKIPSSLPNETIQYKDYENIGLGKFLDDKFKVKAKSGETLNTYYKNKLANLFFDSEEINWDMLSKEAQELTKQLIKFIKASN